MKFLIAFALCIAAASAAPASDVEVVSSSFDNIGIDGYKFEYVDIPKNTEYLAMSTVEIHKAWIIVVIDCIR